MNIEVDPDDARLCQLALLMTKLLQAVSRPVKMQSMRLPEPSV